MSVANLEGCGRVEALSASLLFAADDDARRRREGNIRARRGEEGGTGQREAAARGCPHGDEGARERERGRALRTGEKEAPRGMESSKV